jgi:Mn2+/Fe2+ NRAMP family transporter
MPARSIKDPIRRVLTTSEQAVEPDAEELVKKTTRQSSTSAAGTPKAGRSSVDEALAKRGPIGLLQVLGPGLITGASDDDPSGISTYAQVGSQYGTGLLWMALITYPLMAAVQEMCARIALHTGVGLGVTLRKKFPTWLVALCIIALVVANTVNLGADLGAVAAGGELLSRDHIHANWLIVPAALLIIGLQLFTSYATIFRLFKYLSLALFAYVITVFIVHPPLVATLIATVIPHVQWDTGFVTAVVAVLGTTISPYLFFWQASSEVDEMKAAGALTRSARRGVSRKELRAARFDIMVGMGFSQLVMYCIILTSATVLHAHGQTNIQTAQEAANALQPIAGQFAFILFAAGMIGTGLLAVPILSGSAAYALKEFMNISGSLAVKFHYRPTFYVIIIAATAVGAALNFDGVNPVAALFIAAVINGVVAPPLLLLIVLLASDRKIMGAHVSGKLSQSLTWMATAAMTAAALVLGITLLRQT